MVQIRFTHRFFAKQALPRVGIVFPDTELVFDPKKTLVWLNKFVATRDPSRYIIYNTKHYNNHMVYCSQPITTVAAAGYIILYRPTGLTQGG